MRSPKIALHSSWHSKAALPKINLGNDFLAKQKELRDLFVAGKIGINKMMEQMYQFGIEQTKKETKKTE